MYFKVTKKIYLTTTHLDGDIYALPNDWIRVVEKNDEEFFIIKFNGRDILSTWKTKIFILENCELINL